MTFIQVPEIYQQICIENGAEFPDELVKSVKESPEQAQEFLAKNKQLKDAIVNIYKSNKDTIVNAISNTGMFAKGGKLDYAVQKFKAGGPTRREAKEAYRNIYGNNKGFGKAVRDIRRNSEYNPYQYFVDEYANRRNRKLINGISDDIINNLSIEEPNTAVTEDYTALSDANLQDLSGNIRQAWDNLSFGQAFNDARRSGAKVFDWRGGRYTTELGKKPVQSTGNIQQRMHEEAEKEAMKPGGNWGKWWTVMATSGRSPLRKSGGSIPEAKNKINNEYIAKLEKSGKTSAKEMEDISKERKNKLNKISKHQFGGKYSIRNGSYSVKNGNYYARVKEPGDTLRTKEYLYSTRNMRTFPNGNVLYTKITGGSQPEVAYYWSPESKTSFIDRLLYGNKQVPKEEALNWENIIANHPEDPRNLKVVR